MLIKDIFKRFDEIIPIENSEDWDNSGEQIKFSSEVVNRVLTTLEVTNEVIDEAISRKCNLILSHHPLVFSNINTISDEHPRQKMIMKLISNKISVYSAHTNYDISEGGTSDYLTKQLDLNEVGVIPDTDGFAMQGRLKAEMKLEEFIKLACEVTNTPIKEVRFTGYQKKNIRKVGLCAGSGSEFLSNAYNAGCDVFVTGDVKYHTAQDSLELGIPVVDMGHFHTEKSFANQAAKIFGSKINSIENPIEFIPSEVDVNPFSML